jgi:carbonic anhydrase/acetyltransferase-like protein (isoleucine patch superfamily)
MLKPTVHEYDSSNGDALRALGDLRPQAAPGAWLAPGSVVAGSVRIDEDVSIWYGAVLRAEGAVVEVGPRTNIQDGAVVHCDPGFDCLVGADVSIGHRAVLHGCTVEDGVLIGMGALVLNGARIGSGSLVAAGSVVVGGTVVPARSLVAGLPAKVRRPLTDSELAENLENARTYVKLARQHAAATRLVKP